MIALDDLMKADKSATDGSYSDAYSEVFDDDTSLGADPFRFCLRKSSSNKNSELIWIFDQNGNILLKDI